ncbi:MULTISPECIES: hypothetical protein [Bradyrhizobium]|nr:MULTISPECIES: hypothetical protein [Bradyrhizobium]MCP1755717.1 hypothetical protein [Bradyrhizobium elkanii]MCS3565608.1 hypothetical protein [Bradyrhizobium elkanii]MCW2153660.1 hypothetical protein [Bradyrhizobium elkanii]MCW2196575.1 hypothetical protein [Bradyrhizobium elkanii]MCW2208235.1 hypothetical protein [Bradyrhizobium elkanii]
MTAIHHALDFQLSAENADVYICGHLREVHLIVAEKLTDQERGSGAIKADFSRVAKEKSAIFKSSEKNTFCSTTNTPAIANLCADPHASISDAPAQ